MEVDKVADEVTELEVDKVTNMVAKIPNEDFTDETLTINDTYGGDVREFVVLVMEVDKVADQVTNMEIDMQTDMVVNITNEEFIGVTRVIGGQIYN